MPKASSNGLPEALGYRVEADGDVGVVVGVPLAGQPPRPLALVRDGDRVPLRVSAARRFGLEGRAQRPAPPHGGAS
jgi:hypothetical protein